MRILLVHNYYKQAGGEDTVFHEEAALLATHGHEVEMLTFSNKDVVSIKDKLTTAVGVVYNWKSGSVVEQKILAFKPDVIHVHNFFPVVSPAVFFVAQKHKIPVVMTLHNYRLVCPSALLYYKGRVQYGNTQKIFPVKAILDKAYRDSYFQTASVVLTTGVHKLLHTWRNKVDRFIALTPGAAELFMNSSLRLRAEQLAVKPNFTGDLGLGMLERGDYFLYIGRLTPEKGIRTLLQASKLHSFKLKIIGDGPLRAEVEAYAAMHASVEYLGYRQREQIQDELKGAKALLFTSEWLETFGMTIIEAFSTGTPVIAARIGGAAHLVQHDYNGLLYTPGNAEELAEKIKALQTEPEKVTSLGRGARASYEAFYTPQENYKLLLGIYQAAIAEKRRIASSVKSIPEVESFS